MHPDRHPPRRIHRSAARDVGHLLAVLRRQARAPQRSLSHRTIDCPRGEFLAREELALALAALPPRSRAALRRIAP